MLLVAATVAHYGLSKRPDLTSWTLGLGLFTIYLMLFLRLGMAERSHLIEYSVLAVFIYRAVGERMKADKNRLRPALIALGLTLLLGTLDEVLQLFLPGRVFDPVDIFFNGMAALLAIGSVLLLQWIRRRVSQ